MLTKSQVQSLFPKRVLTEKYDYPGTSKLVLEGGRVVRGEFCYKPDKFKGEWFLEDGWLYPIMSWKYRGTTVSSR